MLKKQKNHLFLFVSVCILPFISYGQLRKSNYIVNGKTFNKKEVNKQIDFILKEVNIPGLSLAVINNGKIAYYHTYGYQDVTVEKVRKVNNRTKFEAASLSKSFVVFAAYKCVDQGLLSLDTPLYKYMTYDLLSYDERYKLITARMVLSHTSGIENHKDKNDKNKLEILAQPGTSYIYSGEGYVYLSKVIEKITGVPTELFLKKNVYQPLKIKHTYTTSTDRANRNHASAHTAFGRLHKREKNKKPNVKSHIHTTAKGYARLLIGIFANNNISKSSVSQILTPQIKIDDQFYYGPGFQLHFSTLDTLLFQGGSNRGFKGLGVYSKTSNSGFVYFGNAERADLIGLLLCKISTGIDISPYFQNVYSNPYPSNANEIFKAYAAGGEVEARTLIDKYLALDLTKSLTDKDIVELVYRFKDENYDLTKYIANEYFKKYPNSNAGKVVAEYGWLKK